MDNITPPEGRNSGYVIAREKYVPLKNEYGIVRNEYGISWITSRDGYVLIRDPYITIDYGVLIWINTLLRLRDISIKTNINI